MTVTADNNFKALSLAGIKLTSLAALAGARSSFLGNLLANVANIKFASDPDFARYGYKPDARTKKLVEAGVSKDLSKVFGSELNGPVGIGGGSVIANFGNTSAAATKRVTVETTLTAPVAGKAVPADQTFSDPASDTVNPAAVYTLSAMQFDSAVAADMIRAQGDLEQLKSLEGSGAGVTNADLAGNVYWKTVTKVINSAIYGCSESLFAAGKEFAAYVSDTGAFGGIDPSTYPQWAAKKVAKGSGASAELDAAETLYNEMFQNAKYSNDVAQGHCAFLADKVTYNKLRTQALAKTNPNINIRSGVNFGLSSLGLPGDDQVLYIGSAPVISIRETTGKFCYFINFKHISIATLSGGGLGFGVPLRPNSLVQETGLGGLVVPSANADQLNIGMKATASLMTITRETTGFVSSL